MAIIIDPSIAKGQGVRQPSPLPPQPPPSYAESATTQPLVVQSGTHVHGYGPTPIGQQQATLPYYDPRSVHSAQAAKKRAKERFAGAVLWVLLIFALLSVLVWMDVRIQLGWSVSCCALLRTKPHRPSLSPQTVLTSIVLVIGYIGSTYIGSKRVVHLLVFGSLCAGDHQKGLFRRNHRERVVAHQTAGWN